MGFSDSLGASAVVLWSASIPGMLFFSLGVSLQGWTQKSAFIGYQDFEIFEARGPL